MTSRRDVVLGCGAALCLSAAGPAPDPRNMVFRISRHGRAIGTHAFEFVRDGAALTVTIAVDIAAGLGPIVFYRYRHRAVERWRGETFESLDAETNDDGERSVVSMRRDGAVVRVAHSGGPDYAAPGNALPATHWNRRMLAGPMINNQTGALMRPSIASLGLETLDLPGGAVRAEHLTLRGDADLDTWYDALGAWMALRFTAKDGTEIRYERQNNRAKEQ